MNEHKNCQQDDMQYFRNMKTVMLRKLSLLKQHMGLSPVSNNSAI